MEWVTQLLFQVVQNLGSWFWEIAQLPAFQLEDRRKDSTAVRTAF